MTTTAKDAAKYLLSLEDECSGDLISNLKLQKLLYFAQAAHLALADKPLFNEKISAWQHGPVCSDVYHEYKHHGSGAIPAPVDWDSTCIGEEEAATLKEVHTAYGQFSAWRLREITHAEGPWKDYFGQPDDTIPHAALKSYFSKFVS